MLLEHGENGSLSPEVRWILPAEVFLESFLPFQFLHGGIRLRRDMGSIEAQLDLIDRCTIIHKPVEHLPHELRLRFIHLHDLRIGINVVAIGRAATADPLASISSRLSPRRCSFHDVIAFHFGDDSEKPKHELSRRCCGIHLRLCCGDEADAELVQLFDGIEEE
ncbi:MAG: hypothetical protein Q7R81_02755 [Candidatus Peregrinibacteria bacterium]|nr:hypothetical protein [Candidatus Peregrinibacteria bacterium]